MIGSVLGLVIGRVIGLVIWTMDEPASQVFRPVISPEMGLAMGLVIGPWGPIQVSFHVLVCLGNDLCRPASDREGLYAVGRTCGGG